MTRTSAQRERQQTKHRDNGRYAKVNPCYICGKSAGIDYLSDHRSDSTDSEGNEWNDEALCLCGTCGPALAKLPDGQAYRIAIGEEEAPWLKR